MNPNNDQQSLGLDTQLVVYGNNDTSNHDDSPDLEEQQLVVYDTEIEQANLEKQLVVRTHSTEDTSCEVMEEDDSSYTSFRTIPDTTLTRARGTAKARTCRNHRPKRSGGRQEQRGRFTNESSRRA